MEMISSSELTMIMNNKMINDMNTRTITIGSQVRFRGAWGRNPQKVATVLSIERTASPSDKYGVSVDSVDVDDTYILDLSDGHWCYSRQVDGVVETP
jgi:hypothetical protein